MTKKSVTGFRRWQNQHPNFMTPDVVNVKHHRNTFVEVSEGRGFPNKRGHAGKIYGTTIKGFSNDADGVFLVRPRPRFYISNQLRPSRAAFLGLKVSGRDSYDNPHP